MGRASRRKNLNRIEIQDPANKTNQGSLHIPTIFRRRKLTLEIMALLSALAAGGLVCLRNSDYSQHLMSEQSVVENYNPNKTTTSEPSNKPEASVALPTLPPDTKKAHRFELPYSRKTPYNNLNLPTITIFSGKYQTSAEERQFYLSEIYRFHPKLRGSLEQLLSVYKTFWIKPEPDIDYASKIEEEAINSIQHVFKFMAGTGIHPLKFQFDIIKDGSELEIQRQNSAEKIQFYLVSTMGVTTSLNSTTKYLLSPISFTLETIIAGQIPLKYDSLEEFEKTYPSSPVFLNTSDGSIFLIETPALEALHKAIAKYTVDNIMREYEERRLGLSDVGQLIGKHTKWEEKMVHSIGVLWLNSYNKQRKLGISDEEIQRHINDLEINFQYRGIDKLSREISRMGITNAIKIYRTDPAHLFSGY